MLVFVQLIGIVAVNLVPLAGVLWFGWSVFEVIFLYWFENVAIAISHFMKMRMCAKTNSDPQGRETANFFLMHYGIFTTVHGVFILTLFGVVANGLANYRGGLPGPVFMIMAWQFVSLFIDAALTARFKGQRATDMLFEPYPRMLALHVTIIAGGWFISEAGSPIWALVLLVALKTVGEVAAFILSMKAKTGEFGLSVEATDTGYVFSLRKKADRPPQ